MKKAIILLSGGLDSTVCAAFLKSEGYELYGISFEYGQTNEAELQYAKNIASHYCVESIVLQMPRISPLAGNYYPARNTIFLSLALSFAEFKGINKIAIGANSDDTFFPDCQPEYYDAFAEMASLATKNGPIKILTPLVYMSKADIITCGLAWHVDFYNTMTCYNGNNCGVCASCQLRRKAFAQVNQPDPIKYLE